jgi:hypothetical protein
MGRSGLRHVDNPAVVGHIDMDAPSPKPGMPIPELKVPRDGRGTDDGRGHDGPGAAPTECDTPINIQFAFVTKLS